MAISLSSLLTPLTTSGVTQTILDLLSTAGFPVTSWHSTSGPRTLVGAFAKVIADASITI